MSIFSTKGQFGGYMQNPQWGGGQQYRPGSAMHQWQMGPQLGQHDWADVSFDPDNPFGTTYQNYQTGRTFQFTPQAQMNDPWLRWLSPGKTRALNIGGKQAIWKNPSGDLMMNPAAMNLGALGGGVAAGKGGWEFDPYQGGDYQSYGKWSPDMGAIPQSTVDPRSVVEAQMPWINEQMMKGFAEAGARMGQSGFAGGTPYAEALGEVSRKAATDLNALNLQYQFAAAEAQAQREQEAQQAALNRQLAGWQTHGGWEHGAQMQDLAQQYGGWALGQELPMQYDLQNRQMDLQAQLANQNFQQSFLNNLFGSLMGGLI